MSGSAAQPAVSTQNFNGIPGGATALPIAIAATLCEKTLGIN
jgi:hypothetical protein